MKIVTIPNDIALVTRKGESLPAKPSLSFKEFVVECVDQYAPEGGRITPKMARQSSKIVAAVDAANGTMPLEDADWELLKSAVEKNPYAPIVARQIIPFFDAVEKATDQ